MGVTGLMKALRPLSRDVDVREYRGLAVGVDASAWLHRAYWPAALGDGGADEAALRERVRAYFAKYVGILVGLDIRVTVVFDGEAPAAKRAKKTHKTLAAGGDGRPAPSPSSCVAAAAAGAEAAGGAVVRAPCEADAQLAFFARRGDVDAVLTDDSDLLAFGAPRVLLGAVASRVDGATTLQGDEVELRSLGAVAADGGGAFLDWHEDTFLAYCVACGCDYLPQIVGVGPAKAWKIADDGRTPERILQRLLAEKHAPPRYGANFRRAFAFFRHMRVVDPASGKQAHLRPLTNLDRDQLGLPPFAGGDAADDDFADLFGPLDDAPTEPRQSTPPPPPPPDVEAQHPQGGDPAPRVPPPAELPPNKRRKQAASVPTRPPLPRAPKSFV